MNIGPPGIPAEEEGLMYQDIPIYGLEELQHDPLIILLIMWVLHARGPLPLLLLSEEVILLL